MNVYEAVKQTISTREAAELYGIEVKRNGMACCPFHDDKTPSMKIDHRFHCFGCGADGDVINFTSRLYNLSPKEAAEKLAHDFGLSYDSQAPPKKNYIRQKSEAQKFKEAKQRCFRVLAEYLHLLRRWETDYTPLTPDEKPHPRFIEALHRKDRVEYLLDLFIYGSVDEQKEWIAGHTTEIAKLERRNKKMAEKQTNKERLREITDGIEQGIRELFESEKYMRYLSVMSRFHKYSLNNTMLIYMQKPDATLVAGYNKWQNQFERHVKKGEHGITIIAPTPFKKKIEEQKLDPDTKAPMLDKDGKIIMEEKEIEIPMFRPVKVFDVSQTDGKPLPQLAANLTGNVQNYEVFIEALRRSAPVPITFEAMSQDTDGYFSLKDQRIAIRSGMSEVQTVSATVHEIAHSKLHNAEAPAAKDETLYQEVEIFDQPALFSNWRLTDEDVPDGLIRYDLRGSDDDPGEPIAVERDVMVNHAASIITARPLELPEEGYRLFTEDEGLNFTGGEISVRQFIQEHKKDRNTEEVEAESISYAVCQYYGIQTGENSFGYIATWSKGKELPELKASLETINKTANELISDIDRNYREICKERGIDLTAKQEEKAPVPVEPVVEYRVLTNEHSHNELDRSTIQAYTITDGEAVPGKKLGAGRTERCEALAEHLNNGALTADEVKAYLDAETHKWHCYVIPDIQSWNVAVSDVPYTPIEFYDSYAEAAARFKELRTQNYNQGHTLNPQTDKAYPHLVFGIQRENPPSAADLIHVRAGQNYLVDDFTRMDALNSSDEVMEVLQKLHDEIGFDRINRHELDEHGEFLPPVDMPFAEWNNSYFEAQPTERLSLIDGTTYLNIWLDKGDDLGYYYTLYDADTKAEIDGGVLSDPDISILSAEREICQMHELPAKTVVQCDIALAEELWQTAYKAQQPKESGKTEATTLPQPEISSLPEIPEQKLDEYPMPDTALVEDALQKCGYLDGDLLPLSKERAYELMEKDLTVYMIQEGENPEMAFDTYDLDNHDGIFAVSREEWEQSPEFHDKVMERQEHQKEREQAFLSYPTDSFAIYQVKRDDPDCIRLMNMEWLKEHEIPVSHDNYDLIYTAPLAVQGSIDARLESLYEQFNLHHPADYHSSSLSVSDIVAIKQDGKVSYHYCDSIGFAEVPGFLPNNPLKNAEMAMEDDYGMIDGIINNGPKEPTVAQLEQQSRSGQPISLMDLADAIHREERDRKKSVVEQLKEAPKQERKKTAPKKSAEREI